MPGDAEKTEAFGAKILELCIEVGGTITGEHGVGVEKIDEMCVQFASPELERFHAIKHAFDEKGLLNPGKAVPTLHRCAEMGAHARASRAAAPSRLAAFLRISEAMNDQDRRQDPGVVAELVIAAVGDFGDRAR